MDLVIKVLLDNFDAGDEGHGGFLIIDFHWIVNGQFSEDFFHFFKLSTIIFVLASL